MKVLLIPPTSHYKDSTFPNFLSFSDFPSGFGYLVASLKSSGHDVIGLNPNNIIGYATPYDMIKDKITKCLKETNPSLIGLGGLCTDYSFLKDAIKIIREISKTPIVLGGQIVTNDAEFIFNHLKPDYAIVGEGEEAMNLLAGNSTLGQIDNFWYWADGKATFTKTNYNYKPIDELPIPDYEPFGVQDMMDNYSICTRVLYRYSRPDPRVWGIVTARSCPFNCSFCVHQRGPKYRARSIGNIMEEIKVTYEKYHFNILLILDELFAVNKARMREFCEAILEGRSKYGWDFDWTFQTHASAALDKDALALARKAGCYLFSYGLESASPIVLESMNKKMKIGQVVEAIRLAKEAKIGFSANLIFGDPAETEETMKESLKFWMDYGQDSFIFLSFVAPYPGSKIFDDCLVKGLIKDKVKYYETIDQSIPNLTTIPNEDLLNRAQFLFMCERSWLLAKTATVVCAEVEKDLTPLLSYTGERMYKIQAKCPHCGGEALYKQPLKTLNHGSFLGTGCTQCHRRMRIGLN